MREKKHIALKKLIQTSGLDKLTPDFTETVMNDIRSGSMMGIQLNAVLKKKLKNHGIESLAPELAKNTMTQVRQLNTSKAAKPIIPSYIWIGISGLFGILLVFLAGSSSDHPSSSSSILQKYFTAPVSSTIANISSGYLIIVISVGLLCTVDYLFRIKVYKQNTE